MPTSSTLESGFQLVANARGCDPLKNMVRTMTPTRKLDLDDPHDASFVTLPENLVWQRAVIDDRCCSY